MRLLTGAVLASCFLVAAGSPRAAEGERPAFPVVAGWKFAPPPGDSLYTPDNLWDMIDGAADLYLGYGFEDLRIGEYTDAGGTDVRVELYRFSSTENAFGVYSQERNPGYRFVEIGTQGYVEDKVLNFLCGVYYVKISSHREGKTGREAMLVIGRRIAEYLQQRSGWPTRLEFFPEENKLPDTESYIAENFLGYRFFHSAFIARYEGGCMLFIMEFDSPLQARAVAEAYMIAVDRKKGLKEGEITDIADPRNDPIVMLLRGRVICGAIDPTGSPLAHRYIELLGARLPGGN